jgi:hypothetical protein
MFLRLLSLNRREVPACVRAWHHQPDAARRSTGSCPVAALAVLRLAKICQVANCHRVASGGVTKGLALPWQLSCAPDTAIARQLGRGRVQQSIVIRHSLNTLLSPVMGCICVISYLRTCCHLPGAVPGPTSMQSTAARPHGRTAAARRLAGMGTRNKD